MRRLLLAAAVLTAALLSAREAQGQVEANRLCLHNGAEYYVPGTASDPVRGGGKYFPSFTHQPAQGVPGGDGWTYPWKIRGWAWQGMMPLDESGDGNRWTWVWETALQKSVDDPWSTSMTWDYPVYYCLGMVPHGGAPTPMYVSNIPSTLPSCIAGQPIVYPSSHGGFDPFLNIIAAARAEWTLPSYWPFYGYEFALILPPGSEIYLPSNTSVYEYVWDNQGSAPQYILLSSNEKDCTGLGGGNKGKSYSLRLDDGYAYYFPNYCGGADSEWAMCLFLEDAVTIPVNSPGSMSAHNPFAAYGFDCGVATVTPNAGSGQLMLQFMTEDYANPGCGRIVLAGSPWKNLIPFGNPAPCVPYGKAGYRLPHANDSITAFFISVGAIWYHQTLPAYPGCMYGTTVGGHTIGVPFPTNPAFKGLELRYSSFSVNGRAPSASFMATYF